MMKILVNDGIHPKGEQLLQEAGFEVDMNSIPQEELKNKLNEYDAILVRSATKVRADLIDACPNLKLIGRGGVGLDNIDVQYAKDKGIEVINTPAASSNSVAELVFGHLLATNRFLAKTNREMGNTGFDRFKALKKESSKGMELYGKTLGIIGFGRIGHEVARIAIGMGMHVIAHDPYINQDSVPVNVVFHPAMNLGKISVDVQMVSKEVLLNQSDFVTLHMPGGGEYVLSTSEFNQMKNGSVLINCARGGVVDEKAMVEALDSGKLSAAGLDVFEVEPPVDTSYFNRDNVSLSPHIGAATSEAQARIGEELANKIIHHFRTEVA